jgi:hypothetical protein
VAEPEPRLRVRLTLVDCASPYTGALAPADLRLRRLLKAALRGYGFRAVAVEEVTPPAPNPGVQPS